MLVGLFSARVDEMIELAHDRAELLAIADLALSTGQQRLHLDPLVGVYGPVPYVEAGTFRSVLAAFTEPHVVVRWDGDKVLSILRSDRTVLASIELLF